MEQLLKLLSAAALEASALHHGRFTLFLSISFDLIPGWPGRGQEDIWSETRVFPISSWYTCFLIEIQTQQYTLEWYGTLKHTLKNIERLHDGDATVAEQYSAPSVLSLSLMLSKLALVGITPCVDLYAIFRYAPGRALPLHMSHVIEECTINMLGNSTRTSGALMRGNEASWSFPGMKMGAFATLHAFL